MEEVTGSVLAEEAVGTVVPVEGVLPAAAFQGVGPEAADEDVVSAAADEDVVAAEAADDVVPGVPTSRFFRAVPLIVQIDAAGSRGPDAVPGPPGPPPMSSGGGGGLIVMSHALVTTRLPVLSVSVTTDPRWPIRGLPRETTTSPSAFRASCTAASESAKYVLVVAWAV